MKLKVFTSCVEELFQNGRCRNCLGAYRTSGLKSVEGECYSSWHRSTWFEKLNLGKGPNIP